MNALHVKAGKDCLAPSLFSPLKVTPSLVPGHIRRLPFPSVLTGCLFHKLFDMVVLAGFLRC